MAKTQTKRITFKIDAPDAQAVFVAGSFNDWSPDAHSLKQDSKGRWQTRISLASGMYEYRFVVDGQWQDDPVCKEYCPNDLGGRNCVMYV